MAARLTFLFLSSVLLLFPACSEKNITNHFAPEPSHSAQVFGRVTPPEGATQVSLRQAAIIASTLTDAQGYFRLSDVPPGMYELRILAPSGAHRSVAGLEIRQDVSVSLGELGTSDLPAPLFACEPEGNEVPVGPTYGSSARFRLQSEVPLDLESMSNSISVEPSLGGRWRAAPWYGGELRFYFLDADSLLHAGKEYVVRIGPALRTEDGVSWEKTYTHRFTTEPFRVRERTWANYGDPRQPLPPDYSGVLLWCRFNDQIDPGSLVGAVLLQPSRPLNVEVVDRYNLRVTLPDALETGTNYLLTIGPPLVSVVGSVMDSTLRIAFRTDRFRLESREVTDRPYEVPPDASSYPLFEDRYNLPLDLESVRAAIRVTPECQYEVRGYLDSYSLYLRGGLTPATDYTVTIGPDLASAGGVRLGTEETVRFRTADLVVEDVVFSSSPWNTGELNPIDQFHARVNFNATVSPDSLGRAARFTPEIVGIWVSTGYPNDGSLSFVVASEFRLQAGDTYTLRIDGTVPLAGAATLRQDVVRSFTVNPVRLEGYSPSNGTTGVFTRTDVDLTFNAFMNRPSVQSAFHLEMLSGDPVVGTYFWSGDDEVRFRPTDSLRPMTLYRATIGTDALDLDGHPLESSVTFYFRTGQ